MSIGMPQSNINSLWTRGLPWLLAACMVQFTSAWIYAGNFDTSNIAESLANSKQFGVPFQYALWLSIALSVTSWTLRRGLGVWASLMPFVPYGLTCLVAGALGFNPIQSLRMATFWAVALLSATCIAAQLSGPALARHVLRVWLALMAASVLLATLWPRLGAEAYGYDAVWRGLFTGKNQLGWISSLALVCGVELRRGQPRMALGVVACAAACLVMSDSKGALGATLLGMTMAWGLAWLRGRVSPGLGGMLMGVGLVLAVTLAALGLGWVVQTMGRDLTFTGRTYIWPVYLQEMLKSPLLGEGPGAFTGLSPITVPLAYQLRGWGLILTPHNMFLGVFGDSGVLGLACFLGLMIYLGVVVPLKHDTPWSNALAGVVWVSLVQGLVETHDTFGGGPTWFLATLAQAATVSPRPVDAAAFNRHESWSLQPTEGDNK